MFKIKDNKFTAIFLIESNGTPRLIGKKKFKINEKRTISFKKRTFLIDHTQPTWEEKTNKYFIFDYATARQLNIDSNKPIPNAQRYLSPQEVAKIEVVDAICNGETIKQLIRSTENKRNWGDLILGAIVGAGIGLFAGMIIKEMMMGA